MKPGPMQPAAPKVPYLPPRARRPRPTMGLPLPAGVRLAGGEFYEAGHQFLQADGRWANCGGRGRCRECIRDDAAKSIEQRVREMLVQQFGREGHATLPLETPLFGEGADHLRGRGVEVDLLESVEAEFSVYLDDSAITPDLTIGDLVRLIEESMT